jgi:hypothetical protein
MYVCIYIYMYYKVGQGYLDQNKRRLPHTYFRNSCYFRISREAFDFMSLY